MAVVVRPARPLPMRHFVIAPAIILALAPFAADAAPTYPLAGLYDGPATVESVSGPCGTIKAGDTATINFEYSGPNATEFKYWGASSANPPAIGKVILNIQSAQGSHKLSGPLKTIDYTDETGVSQPQKGSWFGNFGYFDEYSFTIVLNEQLGTRSPYCLVTYDVSLSRTGNIPASD